MSSSAARKAALGTIVTVVFRLLSFAGTQWCYRRLDPAALGRANVRLELVLTSILFLSREGFRLALTRSTCISEDGDTDTDTGNDIKNHGTAWLTIPVTTLVAVMSLLWHLHATESSIESFNTQDDLDYRIAGILYCAAAAVEGWAEPAVLFFLRTMSVAEKASAEGIAVLVKTGTTVLALQYLQSDWPVTSFGVAQMAYALTYLFVLYGRLWMHRKRIRISISNVWHGPTIYMTFVFTAQGIMKFALTEGDRIVLTLLAGSYDQGVYAMGSAYGGLAARLILQPLEENARLLFSRLASSSTSSSAVPMQANGKEHAKSDPNRNVERTTNQADPMLFVSYTVLVKMVLYVGLVFSCLAVNYTQILLNLLAGRKWGEKPEAVAVLSAFCVYTAFLAWNGMTEAFCYGVARDVADVSRLGVAHTITGVLFASVAPLAVARAGTVGLVAANCVAMVGRAVFSVHFAARFLSRQQEKPVQLVFVQLIRSMFPSPIVLLTFVVAYLGTRQSALRMQLQIDQNMIETGTSEWYRVALGHVSMGTACGIGILSLAHSQESEFLRNVRSLWKGKVS